MSKIIEEINKRLDELFANISTGIPLVELQKIVKEIEVLMIANESFKKFNLTANGN